MRDAQAPCDPGGRSDRLVGTGRDHAVDPLGLGKALEGRLVVDRDDRPPVGVGETGRARVAVDRDHEQPAGARRLEQPELRRARPEHE